MAPHLSDDEIDEYVRGSLPGASVPRFEEHFLDCESCLARVRLVEDLVAGLRELSARPRTWMAFWPQAAVACLAVVCIGLGVQVRQLGHELSDTRHRTAEAEASPAAESTPRPAEGGFASLSLSPTVRSAQAQVFEAPPGAAYVVIWLDTGEVGPPGTAFRVTIRATQTVEIARFHDVTSSSDGFVSFPLPISLLKPGEYTVELESGGEELVAVFRVRRPVVN